MSLETSSSLDSNLICSTKLPSRAFFFIKAFKFLKFVFLFNSKFKIAKLPFGTGTLIAFEVNLSFNTNVKQLQRFRK